MFGAEEELLGRAASKEVFAEAVAMVDRFKDYYVSHGQEIYENPSPGNRDGGITTLEEKSSGCVRKGGSSPVVEVLPYGAKAAQHYGSIRSALERSGQTIGANDLHIAAHARSEGLVLVSNNMREFERVPALELENWIS